MQIPGSVLTAVLVAGAVADSPAATGTNGSPAVLILIDKPLNR